MAFEFFNFDKQYLQDVKIVQKAFQEETGTKYTLSECYLLWDQHSITWNSEWLNVPKDNNKLIVMHCKNYLKLITNEAKSNS